MHPPKNSGLLRTVLAVIGSVFLLDALMLLGMGLFNFGILLPLLIGMVFVVIAWRWQTISAWRSSKRWRNRAWLAAWTIFALWFSSVMLFFAFIQADSDMDVVKLATPVKAILILGSGTPHCKVSATLQARLEKALELAKKLPDAKLLVTGGKDLWRDCTEAQVMGDYLRGRGIHSTRIIQEERSTSTQENMTLSLPLLMQAAISAKDSMVLVTSDFHQLRARHIAYKSGYASMASVGADTPLYLRYNAWLREYFAYFSGWLLNEY